MKRFLSLLLAVLLCLTPVMAEDLSQSGTTINIALSQMGYTEGAKELTKYGQRFGYPNGYWCDMFVSWCAREAGLSTDVFPSSISCGEHYKMFKAKGQWQNSLLRGGNYEPRQGDLVLFRSVTSGSITHIGYVLYVEDGCLFTIEGNALTNRLDYPPETVNPLRKDSKEPPDYVTVNQYPLNDKRLYGYATPAYSSREPLTLEGYVDLAKYAELQPELTALADAGVMAGTSSHTFAPRLGMERGAFVTSVAKLCGLNSWTENTPAFADAPQGGPYYDALLAARSAGLIDGGEDNKFSPNLYISGPDAQAILSKARAFLGMEDRQETFSDGDQAYILTPYTSRIDIAKALYAFMQESPNPMSADESAVIIPAEETETAAYKGTLAYRDQTLNWPLRTMADQCCVPLPNLLVKFPELSAPGLPDELKSTPASEDPAPETPASNEDPGLAPPENQQNPEEPSAPVPSVSTLLRLTLEMEGRQVQVEGFQYNGMAYVPVDAAAKLLGVKLQPTPEKTA